MEPLKYNPALPNLPIFNSLEACLIPVPRVTSWLGVEAGAPSK